MRKHLYSLFRASNTLLNQEIKKKPSGAYIATGLSLTVGGLIAYSFFNKRKELTTDVALFQDDYFKVKTGIDDADCNNRLKPSLIQSTFMSSDRNDGISVSKSENNHEGKGILTAINDDNAKKNERMYIKMIRKIAVELGLRMETFSDDWIIALENPITNETKYIWGYSFELNSQVASTLCNDKAALSDILTYKGIPHIEHKLFLSPKLTDWTPEMGTLEKLFLYTKKYNHNVVLKPKEGTGGIEVTHCKNRRDVENALLSLFSTDYGLAASPYEKINDEYRVIMLDNEPKFVFKKERLSVVGDGQKCLRELMIARLNDCPGELDDLIKLDNINKDMSLDEVPAEGEKVPVLWKHNLSAGAKASIDIENNLKEKICELAVKASTAVGIRFASVDIVTVGNDLKVMEINSGVMMERMPMLVPNGEEIAGSIYKEAITKMFNLNPINIPENRGQLSL